MKKTTPLKKAKKWLAERATAHTSRLKAQGHAKILMQYIEELEREFAKSWDAQMDAAMTKAREEVRAQRKAAQ